MSETARILLVDNDPRLLGDTSRLLKEAGYEVLAAKTGSQALRLALEQKPDLVLLGVALPDMDGTEVCRRLKGEAPLAGCLVLVAGSSETLSDDRARGRESGADGHLAWPISNRELLERVEVMLRVKRAEGAQEALRRGEQFLENVFDAIQDGISVLDPNLNVIRTNQWMEQRYAHQMPLAGRKCYEVYQQRRSPCPWCPTLRTIETGETHNNIVPYPSADKPAGWIELFSFPIKDAQGRVTSVIEYVKDVSDQVQAEESARQERETLALVNALNHAANRGDSLDAIIEFFAHRTKDVFSVNEAAVYLLSQDKEYLVLQNLALPVDLVRRIEEVIGTKIPKVEIRLTPGSVYAQVLQGGTPHLTDDPATIQQMMAECAKGKAIHRLVPAISHILGYRSVMSVPLVIDGEAIGIVDMSRQEPFSKSDLERFAVIAEQFTAIFRRRRAEEALRRSLEETAHSQRLLLALSHAAQAVQRARTPEEVYRAISEQVTRLGFDATILNLSDDRTHLIVSHLTLKSELVRAAEKMTRLSIEGYRFPLTPGGFFYRIVSEGETVFSPLDTTPLAEALPRLVRPQAGRLVDLLGWKESIFAPLPSDSEVLGLLVVTGTDLSEADVPAITAFANQAATAIENARLYKETGQLAAFNNSIIQSMAEGITVQDTNGLFTFANPAAAEMLGYARHELAGLHWTAIIPPDQQPIVQAADERRVRGEADRYELDLAHKNGRRISALVSGTPRFDTEGHFAGTVAVFTDITDRKQAEAALQQRASQLALLNEIGRQVTAFLDLDEVLNRAAQLIHEGFGFHHVGLFTKAAGKERLVMRARAGKFALPFPPDHEVGLGEGLVGWVGQHGETLLANDVDADPRYLNPHPERLPTRSELSIPIRIGDEIVGVLDLQSLQPNAFDPSDVTTLETLADQMAVAISNARLYSQAAQRNRELTLLNRVIAATAAGEVLEPILEAVCRELALAFEVPQAAATLFNPQRTEGIVVAEYLAPGRPSALGESIPLADNLGTQHLLIHKTPLVIANAQTDPRLVPIHDLVRRRDTVSLLLLPLKVGEEVVGSLGVDTVEPRAFTAKEVNLAWRVAEQVSGVLARMHLMKERRRLEEQFHQAQKMEAVGRLAGGVAHDLNNLLTVINLSTRFLEHNLYAEDPLYQHVQRIHDAGRRAGNLTRQLLAFSRREIIEPQVLSLNQVLGELDKMLRRLIGEDVALKTRLADDLWAVKVDPTQIEQVVINLAVNARDAMPGGGKLTIETANVVLDSAYAANHMEVEPGGYVLLAVSDTGEGMSDEVRAHLFEPFFTTKERGKGTGLGLATVHGIIKQNGGHIAVYSEVGRGTSFKVYLPRVTAGAHTPSHPSSEGTVLPHGTETLLLAEDEAAVRELMFKILTAQGYRVLVARDGVEALQVAEQHQGPIHLLLTDVVMPRMSGRALADQLRPSRPEMQVLYTSGYTDNAIVHHGVLDENIHFLSKPFELETLTRKVRSVLDSSV